MRLDWLDDILAVLNEGSLSAAAASRHLTQPAFSRRIKAIEDHLGIALVDRSTKPVQPTPSLVDQQHRLRELSAGLRELIVELRQQDKHARHRVVVASQHAITTAIAPAIVGRLAVLKDLTISLRSQNRDECHGLLITRQAELMLVYRGEDETPASDQDYLEETTIGEDAFIPVFAADRVESLMTRVAAGDLPLIAYPGDVFFGVMSRSELLPELGGVERRIVAETALTPAALQLALAGIGLAWVPRSLAAADLARGGLQDLSDRFPSARLLVAASRLIGRKSDVEQQVWKVVTGTSL